MHNWKGCCALLWNAFGPSSSCRTPHVVCLTSVQSFTLVLLGCASPIEESALQECAKQVLGLKDVTFTPTRAIHQQPESGYRWDPLNGQEQWWIDGLTVDPSNLLENMKGLWIHGEPQPVTSTKLENASIGSLPKVTVYIAVHAEHGTHAFFPYHGAKHGGADKDADGRMYQGFQYWFSNLTSSQLGHIVEQSYCNQEGGVEAFRKRASPEEYKRFKEGPFDPRLFMVCSPESLA